MRRHLLLGMALSSMLVLSTGCSIYGDTRAIKPMVVGPDQNAHLAFSIESKSVMYAGDNLALYNINGTGAAVLEVEQVGSAGSKKQLSIPVSPDAQQVKIDSNLFPGLNETDVNAIQSYVLRLTRDNGNGGLAESNKTLTVLSDRGVKVFPDLVYQSGGDNPPGKGPDAWKSADSDAAIEALVNQNIQNLTLSDKKVTKTTTSKAQVSLFPGLDSLPNDVALTRYTIEGTMPRMMVPSSISPSGVTEIFQPSALTLVVSRTVTPVLVSMRASH